MKIMTGRVKVDGRKGLMVGGVMIRLLGKGDVLRLDFKTTLPFTFPKANG